jgi:hypothetical protein
LKAPGEMTQTMYAHINKSIKKFIKKIKIKIKVPGKEKHAL